MKVREKGNSKYQDKEGQKMRRLMILLGYFLCITAFTAGGFAVLSTSGKYNLKKQTVSRTVDRKNAAQTLTLTPGKKDIRQEDGGRQEGQNYSYNEDILTFLFMGIDKEIKGEASGGYAGGGQADALFLLVLNPHEKAMKLIPINRNTMAAIDVYDEQGAYKETITAQICLQHGFGDGGKASCEYQAEAVGNLFYGIPISGYLAVDMDVIPEVVALIGGIDLEALEDVRNGRQEVILTQGQHVHMDGEQTYWYVRYRDSSAELSADSRLARQGQFLAEFISRVKSLAGKDFTVPARIYHEIAGSAVTDISADEVAYLATAAGGYHFAAGQVVMIPGESVSGGNAGGDYDEFYIDGDGFYEMVLDVFYEPAD